MGRHRCKAKAAHEWTALRSGRLSLSRRVMDKRPLNQPAARDGYDEDRSQRETTDNAD